MRKLRRLFKRLSSWARTQQDEERLRAEIEEHLLMQTAENLQAGLSPTEARRQAALKFGGVEAMKEDYRAQKGLPFLETLAQDTRHALRRLRKALAFTITTVLTLALGIGATTSIFTLVHAVLLKSLPVANPNELYRSSHGSRRSSEFFRWSWLRLDYMELPPTTPDSVSAKLVCAWRSPLIAATLLPWCCAAP
jgi:macrolide transport system ATP-binding/permease protein